MDTVAVNTFLCGKQFNLYGCCSSIPYFIVQFQSPNFLPHSFSVIYWQFSPDGSFTGNAVPGAAYQLEQTVYMDFENQTRIQFQFNSPSLTEGEAFVFQPQRIMFRYYFKLQSPLPCPYHGYDMKSTELVC